MTPQKLAQKIVMMTRQKPDILLTRHDLIMTRHALRRSKMFFIEPSWGTKKVEPEDVFNKIREGVKRYGCKLVVFDHLHFLCRSITGRENVEQMISNVTKGFKLLAQELMVPIIVIAQPKIKREGLITAQDMKGSQAILSDCDHAITMNRREIPRDFDAEGEESDLETQSPEVLITLDASRFGGTGTVRLHYEGRLASFIDFCDRPMCA
jgi:replicative DNA helicase